MSGQGIAYGMILLAGLLWAVQPAFLLVASRDFDAANAVTLIWNFGGRLVCLGLLSLLLTRWRRVAVVFRRPRRRRQLGMVLLFDLVFFGGSYVVLTSGARDSLGNLSVHAILFETWPIVSSLLLVAASRRRQDGSMAAWLAFLLLILGFGTIAVTEIGPDRLDLNDALIALGAGAMMGAAVAASQLYVRATPSFGRFRELVFYTFLRAVGAVVLFFVLGFLDGSLQQTGLVPPEIPLRDLGLAALIGTIAGFSPVLLHLGSLRLQANVAMAGVLIGPAAAPLLLAVFGYGMVTGELLAGICLIIAGIALSARIGEITAQFSVTLMATVLVGTYVVMVEGLAYPEFWQVLQALAVFYGLFQAAVLTHTVGRYDRLAELMAAHQIKEAASRRSAARLIAFDPTSAAELMLLTFTGLASAAFILAYRTNDLGGDIVAYVIAVTIIYLLVMCWVYHSRIRMILTHRHGRLLTLYREQTVQRGVSLALVFTLLMAFFAILVSRL